MTFPLSLKHVAMQTLPSTSGRSIVSQPSLPLCRLTRLLRIRRRPSALYAILKKPREEATSIGQPRPEPDYVGNFAALVVLSNLASPVGSAFALDGSVAYDPTGSDEFLKNIAGVAYVLLVGIFLFRLLRRRAAKAKSERVSSQTTSGPNVFTELRAKAGATKPGKATPLTAFLGCCQASLLAVGLWVFSCKVQGALEAQSLPDGYTARNIAITVRTIIVGLSYLATFIFAANGVGLAGLSLQLLFFPGSLQEEEEQQREGGAPAGPQLPRVRITSKPEQLRAAFSAAELLGKQEASKMAGGAATAAASSGGSGSGDAVDADAGGSASPTSSSSDA